MQSITETFKPRVYEYVQFMKSFKKLYPELYAKYFFVIDKPAGQGAAVMISDLYEIKPSTKEILTYIIKEYYRPFNN